MNDWEFVKTRTAANNGTVWRSADGMLFKRIGDAGLAMEASQLVELAASGYPVPEVAETGRDEAGWHYFIERSVGDLSLHDQALADTERTGQVGQPVLDAAAALSARLLTAQARNPLRSGPKPLWDFSERAGFTVNVFSENPDLDTPQVRGALAHALDQLADLPMCRSHLDYGLPNAFSGGLIDWQHHGKAPLGYDVYPMLEIVPFKGGNRGYRFTVSQREGYLTALDQVAADVTGQSLRKFLGEFLLVKCFFFLALMRPIETSRADKHVKWQYRRVLFKKGLEQYECSGTIHTDTFPTLATFTDRLTQPQLSRPAPRARSRGHLRKINEQATRSQAPQP